MKTTLISRFQVLKKRDNETLTGNLEDNCSQIFVTLLRKPGRGD